MADSNQASGTGKTNGADLSNNAPIEITNEQPSVSDNSKAKLSAKPKIFFDSCSHCQDLEEEITVVLIVDPNEEPGRRPSTLSRCRFLQKEITRFLTEETRCSLARASAEQLMQRAKALLVSMQQALRELEEEFPMEQRHLWLGHQIEEYNTAMQKLRDFIW